MYRGGLQVVDSRMLRDELEEELATRNSTATVDTAIVCEYDDDADIVIVTPEALISGNLPLVAPDVLACMAEYYGTLQKLQPLKVLDLGPGTLTMMSANTVHSGVAGRDDRLAVYAAMEPIFPSSTGRGTRVFGDVCCTFMCCLCVRNVCVVCVWCTFMCCLCVLFVYVVLLCVVCVCVMFVLFVYGVLLCVVCVCCLCMLYFYVLFVCA